MQRFEILGPSARAAAIGAALVATCLTQGANLIMFVMASNKAVVTLAARPGSTHSQVIVQRGINEAARG